MSDSVIQQQGDEWTRNFVKAVEEASESDLTLFWLAVLMAERKAMADKQILDDVYEEGKKLMEEWMYDTSLNHLFVDEADFYQEVIQYLLVTHTKLIDEGLAKQIVDKWMETETVGLKDLYGKT